MIQTYVVNHHAPIVMVILSMGDLTNALGAPNLPRWVSPNAQELVATRPVFADPASSWKVECGSVSGELTAEQMNSVFGMQRIQFGVYTDLVNTEVRVVHSSSVFGGCDEVMDLFSSTSPECSWGDNAMSLVTPRFIREHIEQHHDSDPEEPTDLDIMVNTVFRRLELVGADVMVDLES